MRAPHRGLDPETLAHSAAQLTLGAAAVVGDVPEVGDPAGVGVHQDDRVLVRNVGEIGVGRRRRGRRGR